MKSEPDVFSIDDLNERERWHWDGVRGYEARNTMRDLMNVGDFVIFYHSSCVPAGPAGIAKVASPSYPDFTQFDKTSKYYDPKATNQKPIWFMVDVSFVRKFPRTITRDELRASKKLIHMKLWKRNRLSITDITKGEFDAIIALADRLV